MGSNPAAVTLDIVPVLSKEFLDIQETIEWEFTTKKLECDMTITSNHVNVNSTKRGALLKKILDTI